MPLVRLRIADTLWDRFEAFAAGRGSTRAAAIRFLVAKAVRRPLLAGLPSPGRLHPRTIELRISKAETAALHAEAAALGLSRAGWVSALVRQRLSRKPTLPREDQLALSAGMGELRRIASNLGVVAQALESASPGDEPPALTPQDLDALRREIRQSLTAVRQALEGNRAYWSAEP